MQMTSNEDGAYPGRRVALLTQHGKERVIAAALDDVPRYTRNREAGATWHEEFSVTDRLHISRKTWSVPYYFPLIR